MKEYECFYCDGTGEIEMDNNGHIGECPICHGTGNYYVKAQPEPVTTTKGMED